MKKFRNHTPLRRYAGTQKASYKDYRGQLAEDFEHRCAYTNCSDRWWLDGFHIDHFAPKEPRNVTDPVKKAAFKKLENEYMNLVYVCPQVNRAKSDDWATDDPASPTKGDRGYLDPCSDFNEYFERTDGGAIVPRNSHPHATYMWHKLKLYLRLYELIWRLEQIAERKTTLTAISEDNSLDAKFTHDVLIAIRDLGKEYDKYWDYLGVHYQSIIRGGS